MTNYRERGSGLRGYSHSGPSALNMPRGCCDVCEGQALALQGPGRFFRRGPVPRNRSLILDILIILAILLQTL